MKRTTCIILCWFLGATILLSAPLPAKADEENVAIAYGRQLYQNGELNQSLAVLRAFVQQSAADAESAKALTLIGRILTRQQQYQDAILYLKRIPSSYRTPESNRLLGGNLVKTDHYSEALRLLQPLLNEPFNLQDRTALLQDLALAADKNNQFLFALHYLQQLLPASRQPAAILAQAHDILQNRIDDNSLEEAAFMWQGTEIGQDARLQLARRALVRQQPDNANRQLQQLLASPVMFPYWQEAEILLQRTGTDDWLNRDRVGILLPLSGPYSSYGELVKRGLDLALQEHNRTRLPIRFTYRDTAVEGVSAAQLISSLTDDDKVMAVIGPLLGASAGEAAYRAQREMVPMLSLSQSQELPEIGNFIFRDTLTAEQQVKTLIDYALKTNHISFSVLYPDNRLGRQMSELFVSELKSAGGEIVDVISYPEDTNDFRKQIQQLLWIDEKKQKKDEDAEDLPELEYPLAPFHALFLPDYADRITQLSPQLLFYGVKDVTLLGINGWNSPDIIGRAGRFLKDAVFVDSFLPSSDQPEVVRFMELYRQQYKEEPSILEAQAFDVATLLLQALDDPAVVNRDNLRQKLEELKGFRGVTGTTGFDHFGEATKKLHLLKVKRGRVTEID